jgi:hypothetical protein
VRSISVRRRSAVGDATLAELLDEGSMCRRRRESSGFRHEARCRVILLGVEDDFGHEWINDEDWRVAIDPRLRELPRDDLLEIIERQANAIRVLICNTRRGSARSSQMSSNASFGNAAADLSSSVSTPRVAAIGAH